MNSIKVKAFGTSFGKYGFTITKQELEEKEDNVSSYVLQCNMTIDCCILFIQYFFLIF